MYRVQVDVAVDMSLVYTITHHMQSLGRHDHLHLRACKAAALINRSRSTTPYISGKVGFDTSTPDSMPRSFRYSSTSSQIAPGLSILQDIPPNSLNVLLCQL